MKTKRNRRISIASLIAGYTCAIVFLFLVILNTQKNQTEEVQETNETFALKNEHKNKEGNIIFDETLPNNAFINNKSPEIIFTHPKIIREPNVIVDRDIPLTSRDVVIYGDKPNRDLLIDKTTIDPEYIGTDDVYRENHRVRQKTNRNKLNRDIDANFLDRRLAEINKEVGAFEEYVEKDKINRHNNTGINKNDDAIDISKITLARDNEPELGEIDLDFDKNNGKGYGLEKSGELYAYNYPSRGVGAGIGSSAIGAGAGGGAGIGAGIGEGMLNGEAVPTLGGIGTGTAPLALEGQPADAILSGGVGGLVAGGGAGGAAGLTQGYITEKVGLRVGVGQGSGYKGREYNYDHLPKDGALHIMMHVDGSGSILNTRKNLNEMKNTLLKDALLPYYNNDEDLYNRRVTIISNSGERTLNFFNEAAKKDNVLAIAFQDEAQPSYHLPNFNKKPEDHYLEDIKKLKSSLNGYVGTYRGVMFQVDRGKTFAKSFKEFVGNAFKGEGYLESANLKKYHRDNNPSYIKNKNGIVFSDEYHAKDSGDPQYYLDLIFKASKRVGLDLNIYGAGLKDGNAKWNRI